MRAVAVQDDRPVCFWRPVVGQTVVNGIYMLNRSY